MDILNLNERSLGWLQKSLDSTSAASSSFKQFVQVLCTAMTSNPEEGLTTITSQHMLDFWKVRYIVTSVSEQMNIFANKELLGREMFALPEKG